MNTLLIIDGNAVMHRAYHAIPSFRTKSGIPTNALYGFFSILYKAIIDFNPTHLAISFDTPAETFREKIYKDYQAQRPQAEDDFIVQIPNIRNAVDAAGFFKLEKDGYEGDDIIGTLAAKAKLRDFKVLIFSGDKDILQLVCKNVFVISPQNNFNINILYDESKVIEKLSMKPDKIPELKALTGDPSDNYPGAKGIGPKTAVSLLKEFDSLDNLYQNIDHVKNDRIKKILIDNKDNVFLSKKLATIITDVDLNINLDLAKYQGLNESLKNYLLQFEMYSLVNRLYKKKKELPMEKKIKKVPENQIGLF